MLLTYQPNQPNTFQWTSLNRIIPKYLVIFVPILFRDSVFKRIGVVNSVEKKTVLRKEYIII